MKKIKQGEPKPDKFQCTQCGSTTFTRDGAFDLRCAYCDSLYRVPGREKSREGPTVIIKKRGQCNLRQGFARYDPGRPPG